MLLLSDLIERSSMMPPTARDPATIQIPQLPGFLSARIRREGPITFRDWMEGALYHPIKGYYCRPDLKRWGRTGDYRTSSERSELFAATFARYFARLYEKLGAPPDWTIVEMGGGDGCFARGVLHTLREHFPNVFAATKYVVDEISADSRQRARQMTKSFGARFQFETLAELDQINRGVIFSNELLDAFPVHRITMKEGKLFEFYVTVKREEEFAWILGPLSTSALSEYCEESGIEMAEGQIVEINLAIADWLAQIVQKLRTGYILSVDYGAETNELSTDPERFHGTLRGYRRHRLTDSVLDRPGEQDITSTVDWGSVKRAGSKFGFDVIELISQDKFLLREGLLDELERQCNYATTEAERLRLKSAARDMILPGGMSSSFQVLVQERIPTRPLS